MVRAKLREAVGIDLVRAKLREAVGIDLVRASGGNQR